VLPEAAEANAQVVGGDGDVRVLRAQGAGADGQGGAVERLRVGVLAQPAGVTCGV